MQAISQHTYYRTGTDAKGRGTIAPDMSEDYNEDLRIIDGKIYRIQSNPKTWEEKITLFDGNPTIIDCTALPVTPPVFPEENKRKWLERFQDEPDIVSKCPYGSTLKAGEKVIFTNPNGVRFGPHEILGFQKSNPDGVKGRYIYLDYDWYWFPSKLSQVKRFKP